MNTIELKARLQQPYNREQWLGLAKDVFHNLSILEKPLPVDNTPDFVKSFQQLGFVNLQDGRNLAMIEIVVDDTKNLVRNKVQLRNLTNKLIDEHSTNGVLVIYDNQSDSNYRFTFASKESVINEQTGELEKKETNARRFTYLLGPGESCTTAAMQLTQVANKGGSAGIDDVIKAFNVEKVNKEFFNGYKKHYEAFTTHLSKTSIKSSVFDDDEKAIRDFAKKMLGRIVFIYFLQKKGWMGVPAAENGWTNGDKNFLYNLFIDSGKDEDFYAAWLSNVFFDSLNTERPGHLFKLPNGAKAKVPYLNGGLFERENVKTDLLTFPSALFQNLFDFLSQYNFTIYEDDPEERFLAVDPEMLGHIFENLLEDNKDKGTYYTPKEIVHYMCRESLIEYLYTKLNPVTVESFKEIGKAQTDLFGNKAKKQFSIEQAIETPKELIRRESIEKLVLHHEAAEIISYEKEILKALYDVKICDPAIGSGAFPMGLLTEIFQLVETLHNITPDVTAEVWKLGNDWNAAVVKKQIIQNSIYGVDIEKGAVDIARLRFWLSLIIDEEEPKPLPNLDYKIVVGNSLLSKFEDEVIDIDWGINMAKAVGITKDIIKEQELKLYALHYRQDLYFNQTTGNKKKLQEEIRDIKIDILTNQITLNKISFTEKNPKLGGLMPTSKEIHKNLENQLIKIDFEDTIQKLNTIKKDKKLHFSFFDWKLDFAEVLNEKVAKGNVGFDIVIGNPPYIQLQKLGKYADELQSKKFETFARTGDIYCLFYEVGFTLLKTNGILTFITSNKWMRAAYGEALRKYFTTQANPLSLIDFGGFQVFESATVDTNIFVGQRSDFKNKVNTCVLGKGFSLNNMSDYFRQNTTVTTSFSAANSWVVLDEIEKRIKEKIERTGIPLKDWDVKINYGIKTGFNEAFIISTEKRAELIKKCPKADSIIRPILLGRNIKRYSFEWENLWLINSHNGIKNKGLIPINIQKDYPAIFEHFTKFKTQLEKRLDKGDHWTNLRNCAYIEDFGKPKIAWGNLALKSQFSYIPGDYIINAPSPFFATENLYLLAILNSKLGDYYIKQLGVSRSGGYIEYKPMFVEKLPIPTISRERQLPFVKLVETIIYNQENKIDIVAIENKINDMVFQLFKISEIEKKIILET